MTAHLVTIELVPDDRYRLRRLDPELPRVVAKLYEAFERAADASLVLTKPRMTEDLLAMLINWMHSLFPVCDGPLPKRLIDKPTPLADWVVKHLVTGGIHLVRVAYKEATRDDPELWFSIDRLLDQELAAM